MSEAEPENGEPEAPVEPTEPTEPTEEDLNEDETEAQPAEPEPPEQPQGLSDAEREKRSKTVERALMAYVKKLQEAYAEEALDLIPCPLCSFTETQGFVNGQDAGRVPDEVVRVALGYLGRASSVEYEDDPEHRTCSRCKGLGKLRSGSQVPQWETLQCSACNGTGMLPPPGGVVQQAGAASVLAPTENGQQQSRELADTDEWGESPLLPDGRENPNYGKMPHRKVLVEPWGITAGLVAQDA
jgi:hypothetical protein